MRDSKELSFFNYLKAFAAILVVTHHAIVYSPLYGTSPILKIVYLIAVNVHVPLFFCVAGYLCHKQTLKNFYLKKLLKILIPFLVFTSLKLIYSTFISDLHAHAATLSGPIYDAFICGNLYWFAYAILTMFAAAPLLWRLGYWNLLVFILLFVTNIVLEYTETAIPDEFQLQNTLSYSCYFIGGLILQKSQNRIQQIKPLFHYALLVICILFSSSIIFLRLTRISHLHYWLKVPLACSIMYTLHFISKHLPEDISILEYLGKHSLQIMFFDSFFKVILFPLIKPSNILFLVITVIINISLTCISCYVIQKIPYIRKLFGL